MPDRPILFSAPMVRAILAGAKTQTRRVVKGAPDGWSPVGPETYSPTVIDGHGDEQPGPDAYGAGNADGSEWIRCPYGKPGDRLWVRETWAQNQDQLSETRMDTSIVYRADGEQRALDNGGEKPWRPSIHMPRWASRITLEVARVRVERLQDISEADALAEGVHRFPGCRQDDDAAAFNRIGPVDNDSFPIARYAVLWESINGPGSWDANPWVWVIEFTRQPTPGEPT